MKIYIRTLILILVFQTPEAAYAMEFSELVRNLNSLQNRMVQGDAASREAVARQFELIDDALSASDQKTWTDQKNIRALILFLLSGGQSGAREKSSIS